ncbi:Gfo/Idh/MocA family protein [Mycolicibacterium poriferae]|uniref:Gfo/Idh/MocA family protein n=1 Tax=Mycolicibacterium poriferae TaxID=39694 RepID=UPI0024BB4C41|nr:Gfo/Idh/MocA family oxidoreductase [Mycolicibacterium poriferae]
MTPIGVGIIGASPDGGWAAATHVPALAALPEYTLRAVTTSRAESAKRASAEWGVDGFDSPLPLIEHPGVDLVVVAVKVPDHYGLIVEALAAGKMVLSEWPLALNLAEAEDLAEKASAAGVYTAVGLQGRFAPAVATMRDLVSKGYLGRVVATNLVGSGMAWASGAPKSQAYAFDARNGVTAVRVSTGHALSTLTHVLGGITAVTSALAVGSDTIDLDDGSRIPVTSPDKIALALRLRSGAVGAVFYRGGLSRAGDLRWEINGTEGDLLLTSPTRNGNIPATELVLAGANGSATHVVPIAIPDPDAALGLTGPPGNVAKLYRAFANDRAHGTAETPSFDDAVELHRLLDGIERGHLP